MKSRSFISWKDLRLGSYFQFHAVRRVLDPAKNSFFVIGEPEVIGIHSSYLEMMFTETAQIDPALYAKPAWYTGAFALLGSPITQEHFFEPAQVLGDLERIAVSMLTRDVDLPPFYWLRVGNKNGVQEFAPRCGVDIYYNEEPCSISSGWDGVAIYGRGGKLQTLTQEASFSCRLRESSYGAKDGAAGTVYIEREPFFSHMRPFLFDLFRRCDWALRHRLLVFPMWH
jgi:hypothetical protein